MAATQEKKEYPHLVKGWKNLDSAGDVKRLLRWVILQTKSDRMPLKKAGVLGQLCLYMLKAIEIADIETDLDAVQRRLDTADARESQNPAAH